MMAPRIDPFPKFCKNCGTALNASFKFCPTCGEKIIPNTYSTIPTADPNNGIPLPFDKNIKGNAKQENSSGFFSKIFGKKK